MMVVAASLLGMADTLVHPVEDMGVVLVDKPFRLDMGSTIPQRVVAGYSGKVPVDMRAFARKVVDIQKRLRDSQLKRSPCQELLEYSCPFEQWSLPIELALDYSSF